MVDEESGMGSYTIISHTTGKMVKKQVFWVSIKLHGKAWRLLSIQAGRRVAISEKESRLVGHYGQFQNSSLYAKC